MRSTMRSALLPVQNLQPLRASLCRRRRIHGPRITDAKQSEGVLLAHVEEKKRTLLESVENFNNPRAEAALSRAELR